MSAVFTCVLQNSAKTVVNPCTRIAPYHTLLLYLENIILLPTPTHRYAHALTERTGQMEIPVGNTHELQTMVENRRTVAQRLLVQSIVSRRDFDFGCINPLTEEVDPDFQGPFLFMWYDKVGRQHLDRISKDGRFLFRWVNGEDWNCWHDSLPNQDTCPCEPGAHTAQMP